MRSAAGSSAGPPAGAAAGSPARAGTPAGARARAGAVTIGRARGIVLALLAQSVPTHGEPRARTGGLTAVARARRVVLACSAFACAARALSGEAGMLRRGTCRVVETGDDEDGAEGTQKSERSHG